MITFKKHRDLKVRYLRFHMAMGGYAWDKTYMLKMHVKGEDGQSGMNFTIGGSGDDRTHDFTWEKLADWIYRNYRTGKNFKVKYHKKIHPKIKKRIEKIIHDNTRQLQYELELGEAQENFIQIYFHAGGRDSWLMMWANVSLRPGSFNSGKVELDIDIKRDFKNFEHQLSAFHPEVQEFKMRFGRGIPKLLRTKMRLLVKKIQKDRAQGQLRI